MNKTTMKCATCNKPKEFKTNKWCPDCREKRIADSRKKNSN